MILVFDLDLCYITMCVCNNYLWGHINWSSNTSGSLSKNLLSICLP